MIELNDTLSKSKKNNPNNQFILIDDHTYCNWTNESGRLLHAIWHTETGFMIEYCGKAIGLSNYVQKAIFDSYMNNKKND